MYLIVADAIIYVNSHSERMHHAGRAGYSLCLNPHIYSLTYITAHLHYHPLDEPVGARVDERQVVHRGHGVRGGKRRRGRDGQEGEG